MWGPLRGGWVAASGFDATPLAPYAEPTPSDRSSRRNCRRSPTQPPEPQPKCHTGCTRQPHSWRHTGLMIMSLIPRARLLTTSAGVGRRLLSLRCVNLSVSFVWPPST